MPCRWRAPVPTEHHTDWTWIVRGRTGDRCKTKEAWDRSARSCSNTIRLPWMQLDRPPRLDIYGRLP